MLLLLFYIDSKLCFSHKVKKQAEDVREWGVEADIWSYEGRSNRRLEKVVQCGNS
jgi:hypothetical protein